MLKHVHRIVCDSPIISASIVLAALWCAGCEKKESLNSDNSVSKTLPSGALPGEDSTANSTEPSATILQPDDHADRSATPPINREQLILQSEQHAERGELGAASATLRQWLLVDPSDSEVIFRLANLSAAQGNLADGIELLQAIPNDDPEAGLPALGQSADWSMDLKQYTDAERGYLKILEIVPQAAAAHRKLAFLYNRQGRRHEAARHVYHLCRLGNVRQDELHSLIQLSDAMFDPPTSDPSNQQTAYFPIGPSGIARKQFMDEQFQQAVETLYPSVAAGQQPASIVAFFGRACAEAQDDARFNWWLDTTDAKTREFAEYWAAIGTMLWTQRKPEMATRALLEAIERDPRDFRSIVRLRAALKALGKDDEAELWSERWKTLRSISAENNRVADSQPPNLRAMAKLAELLASIDRNLESVVWRYLAGVYQHAPKQQLQQLQLELRQLVASNNGLPDRDSRLCGMSVDSYPLPPQQWRPETHPSQDGRALPRITQPTAAEFENVAAAIGLSHAYHVASQPQQRGFSVYQSIGGAVGVLDFDLDGHADLYLAQGGADPPQFIGSESNVLYRNESEQLVEVTRQAGAIQHRYSTGVTVGDWNQDGFADVAVANIGRNSLWINAGDGTFRHVDFDTDDDNTLLTTSLAMGDLNRDAIPDVFELNYLHDPELSKRPQRNEQGQVVGSLMPADFKPGTDRVILNNGKGIPTFSAISDSDNAAKGLGLILGDFDISPGNEIFVGNDTDPNQLWVRREEDHRWVDLAMLRGCAYGFDGVPTASMGIAAADFDRSGSLDFHVTNFQDECVSFYVREGELFHDRNVRFELAEPSDIVLGFGTQSIDYDNDGRPDLVVTNGHIEQATTIRAPFKQPPQLFSNLGNRFSLVSVDDPSNYWSEMHVGRGLARLDFDRDGKSDLVLTHLGETTAMLLNRTPTTNHWLQLQLVGTHSERNAIGARVDVEVNGKTLSEWIVSGDGFFARNENVLMIGLGADSAPSRVTVHWPGEGKQVFTNVSADRRWLLVQGADQAFCTD